MYKVTAQSKYGKFSIITSKLELSNIIFDLTQMAKSILTPTEYIGHIMTYKSTLIYQGDRRSIIGKLF